MKKLLFNGFLGTLLAFSLNAKDTQDENFEKFLNSILTNGANAKITKTHEIKGSKIRAYEVQINFGGKTFDNMYFSDGVVFIDDERGGSLIDMQNKKSPKVEYMVKQTKQKQEKMLPELAKFVNKGSKYLIKLGNDKNKPTMVVFSDPECPFCERKLRTIKDDLKNNNVIYVLTPVHGKTAYEKVLNIIEESKKAKTDDEKIAILNKYYNPSITNYKTYGDEAVKTAFEDVAKIMNEFSIQATPTIIENVPLK